MKIILTLSFILTSFSLYSSQSKEKLEKIFLKILQSKNVESYKSVNHPSCPFDIKHQKRLLNRLAYKRVKIINKTEKDIFSERDFPFPYAELMQVTASPKKSSTEMKMYYIVIRESKGAFIADYSCSTKKSR